MNLTGKRLQVWHYPQVPCNPFQVDVKDEYEAVKIINTLADQHIWLLQNKMIPDYSNTFEVVMWDEEEQDWAVYYNETEGLDWSDFEEVYENEIISQIV